MATNPTNEHPWLSHALEPPEHSDGVIDWNLVWLHRRKQGVQQPRPVLCGDVFEDVTIAGEESPVTLAILQHPCALMDANNELRAVLLAARVVDHPEVSISDWTRKYDIMPLVVHDSDPLQHRAIAFDQLLLVPSADLPLKKRVACMEIEGVSRLLQRWTNVNTRVIVPCWRFEQVVDAQFAEADGMEAWCSQRLHAGVKQPEGMKEATAWLDEKLLETGKPRRLLLKDPTNRKSMVRLMHNVAKEMTERDQVEKARIKAGRVAAQASEAPQAEASTPAADEQPVPPET